MGREIRMVPPNWEHPRERCQHSPQFGGCDDAKRNNGQCYRPLFGRSYKADAAEFIQMATDKGLQKAVDWFGKAPDKNDYVPDWKDGEATWCQVYETVSEGTPTTPPFPTKAELINYLCTQKDFWGDGPRSMEVAEAFVDQEYAPSMVVIDGKVIDGIDAAVLHK